MDAFEQLERKRASRHRLRAQRERRGRLQSRVVAASLICFVLLWGIVFTQMATGNDPVLSGGSSRHGHGAGAAKQPRAQPEASGEEAAVPIEEEVPVEEEFVPVEEEVLPEEEAVPVEEEELFEPEPEAVVTGQS